MIDEKRKKLTASKLNSTQIWELYDKLKNDILITKLNDVTNTKYLNIVFLNFLTIMSNIKDDKYTHEFARITIDNWLELFVKLFGFNSITPYIHIFTSHIHEFIENCKCLNNFNAQGLEKNNDTTSRIYFRGSNKKQTANSSYKMQMLQKKNRLEYLRETRRSDSDRVLRIKSSREPCSLKDYTFIDFIEDNEHLIIRENDEDRNKKRPSDAESQDRASRRKSQKLSHTSQLIIDDTLLLKPKEKSLNSNQMEFFVGLLTNSYHEFSINILILNKWKERTFELKLIPGKTILICNVYDDYWVILSDNNCLENEWNFYDSLNRRREIENLTDIFSYICILRNKVELKISHKVIPSQNESSMCALYCLAITQSICEEENPQLLKYDEKDLKLNFNNCINNKTISKFKNKGIKNRNINEFKLIYCNTDKKFNELN